MLQTKIIIIMVGQRILRKKVSRELLTVVWYER